MLLPLKSRLRTCMSSFFMDMANPAVLFLRSPQMILSSGEIGLVGVPPIGLE